MNRLYSPTIFAKLRMRRGVIRLIEVGHRDEVDLDNLDRFVGYRVTKTGERWFRDDGTKIIDGVKTDVSTEELVMASRNDLVCWMRQNKFYGELEEVDDPLAEPEMA